MWNLLEAVAKRTYSFLVGCAWVILTCVWSWLLCDDRNQHEGSQADKEHWDSITSQECLDEAQPPELRGVSVMGHPKSPRPLGQLICKAHYLYTCTLWWELNEYPWVGLCHRHMDRTWKWNCCFHPGIHSTSPRMGSGLLTTADSTTAGCSISALSTSNGPIRYLWRRGSLWSSHSPSRRSPTLPCHQFLRTANIQTQRI